MQSAERSLGGRAVAQAGALGAGVTQVSDHRAGQLNQRNSVKGTQEGRQRGGERPQLSSLSEGGRCAGTPRIRGACGELSLGKLTGTALREELPSGRASSSRLSKQMP